ncbi:hypothetical protein C8J27_11311 [Rhodobacter aestuarii]|uniref:Recombinase zinc beta ribbon domain-containing protein n=1 Tax=Rhodobacter aestuarii TaxID=453582 RepID=A0A1N7QAU0_9RHOB|nr:zinc ribbon domain-containing protein [Rhodobacter aestuarii]PTV93646.1 hypothetical protein C8J27_11311 [Rhodobacter aestuarii]SIT20008.1 hypothetical protein SAMN05421580_11511 [Rhodobacter aestuarii]
MNKVKYGCSAARNRGTCENRQLIHREQIEERVLTGLRDKLLHPALLAEFIAEFQREVQKERLAALSARGDAERKLTKVTKEIDNIVTAITAGMFHPSMKEKMDGLEAERTQLEAQLAATPAPDPITLHPGLADVYRQKVSTLAASLSDDATRPEAIALLRGLISEIRLHPDAGAPGGHVIELYGELGSILSLGDASKAKPRLGVGGVSDFLVAGVGFEPTTFRL